MCDSFDSGQASKAESTMFSGTAPTMAGFILLPKLRMTSQPAKGSFLLNLRDREGGFVPQHLAEQTQLETPPGEDGRLNNPHFIWEGRLFSQGYVFRLRCSLFLITTMKLKIAPAQHPAPIPEEFLSFAAGTDQSLIQVADV